jgi:two-component sensor histidine kinase
MSITAKYYLFVFSIFFCFSSFSQVNEIQELKMKVSENQSRDTVIEALLQLGEKYASVNVDSSILYFEKSYQLSLQGKKSEHHYKITNALGLMYQDKDPTISASYYYECLEEVEQLPDGESLLSVIYLNIGSLHRQNGEADKALEFFNRSMVLMQSAQDSLGVAECYNNIGSTHMMIGEIDKGVEFWTISLELKLLINESLSAANNMSNLAGYYKDTDQLDLAFQYSTEALSIFIQHEYHEKTANTYDILGDIWSKKRNWKKAIESYERAVQLLNDIESESSLVPIYKDMGIALYEDGQNKKARHIFNKWESQLQIENRSATNREILEVAAEYESEKKIKEITLLKQEKELTEVKSQKNEEELGRKRLQTNLLISVSTLLAILLLLSWYFIKQKKKTALELESQRDLVQEKNKLIEEALDQKEILLKEVHHRVKNNLEIISSLIELQSYAISDEKTAELMLNWQNRINSIAMIHRDLYNSDNLKTVKVGSYIDNLVFNISNIYKNKSSIEVYSNLDFSISLHINKTIPLGLIVNEVVSNAYKHAFLNKDGGKVEVSLSTLDDGLIKLTVKDDGSGYTRNEKNTNPESLGLRLVNILVQQLNGSINIDNTHGSKTEIIFNR